MVKYRGFLLACFVLLPFAVARAGNSIPVPSVPEEDGAMRLAFARARAGLDGFLAKLAKPPQGSKLFAVKIGLADSPSGKAVVIVRPDQKSPKRVEFFWVHDVQPVANGFNGRIDNDPETIHGARAGQPIHFVKDDIADWMYVQDGKIKGNATACPALAHATPTERKKMAEEYGIICE
ncbi:YegJ family protein [Methylocystis sp. SC2]|uniref:YegJ family protein n=1 Tax=Methylocystis sp. (strain SC2) TaxID=187303 RepID=UPI00027AEC07|nr:DUF2314 domain-containing protein [Methylocystis sp. SC2]CCJ08686.1 Conserved hypothetical protein [Methylocystis sp. SC2]